MVNWVEESGRNWSLEGFYGRFSFSDSLQWSQGSALNIEIQCLLTNLFFRDSQKRTNVCT